MGQVVSVSKMYMDRFEVAAPPAAVFPLLCPIREYDWLEHWRCELLRSRSGGAEDGCIFRTEFEGGGQMTWIVTCYEPDRRIEFTCFVPEWLIMRLRIVLEPSVRGGTLTGWIREYIAMNREGVAWISSHDEDGYRERMARIQKSLTHYLLTGTCLKQ